MRGNNLPALLIENRKQLWNLARDDFRKKFAGSNLGILWAFIQPVITVLLYWFVFEKGLNAKAANLRTGIEVPFVLWLMAGLVPWFYFQDAWNNGTGVLKEYDYLVKKVVFQIEVLPTVKMISALFVHVFFVAFMIVLFWLMGYAPDLYTIQVIYYSVAMMALLVGLVYATSAVVVFFKDLSQIVSLVLQVGTWATPIMWNIDSGQLNLPEWAFVILKLNPMYYVVSGYRDSLINKVGFWEHPYLTVWFWVFTVIVYFAGVRIFKKLRMLFADVL
jgi:teichoic acid transport system permease protein